MPKQGSFLFPIWVLYSCKSIKKIITKVPSASQSMSVTSEVYWYETLLANKKKTCKNKKQKNSTLVVMPCVRSNINKLRESYIRKKKKKNQLHFCIFSLFFFFPFFVCLFISDSHCCKKNNEVLPDAATNTMVFLPAGHWFRRQQEAAEPLPLLREAQARGNPKAMWWANTAPPA